MKRGDNVSWSSHGHRVLGKVIGKVTGRKKVAGRQVVASKDEPQYHVRSDKTGRDAVHKPGALRKRS